MVHRFTGNRATGTIAARMKGSHSDGERVPNVLRLQRIHAQP